MDKKITSKRKNSPQKSDDILINEIRDLIEQTRSKVAQTVNSALVLMNFLEQETSLFQENPLSRNC